MPDFVGAKERKDADNSLETESGACRGSEITPLLPLGSEPSPRICDELPTLQQNDDSDDVISRADGSVNLGGMLSFTKRRIRYQLPRIPFIASAILMALGVIYMGRLQNQGASAWISLSPPLENAANIKALEEYLGSSVEGLSNAAVASDNALCSKIGKDIMLEKGGNAMDAAVATVLCLGVASPASSGLGGGAFLLVRSSKRNFEENQTNSSSSPPEFIDARTDKEENSKTKEFITEVIDCREVAPEKASRDMYTGLPEWTSESGGLAIAVPGELRGLELAHARHGRLPWKELVEPAILLARNGVTVDRHMARFIRMFFKYVFPKKLGTGDNYISHIVNYLSGGRRDGDYLREGELIRNPQLADTLEEIAENGADALYKGRIAESLVKDIQEAGGILTLNDMQSYKAVLRTPVSADVAGYTVLGVPPPSSGGAVVIGILRFLSGFSTLFAPEDEGLSVHRMVEGMRHAFAIRMSLSDPAFNTNVTSDAVRDLISGGYMEFLRQMSRDDTVLRLSRYGGPKWAQVLDEDGTKEAKDAHEGDRRQRKRRLSESLHDTEKNYKNSSNQSHRRLARPFGYLEDNGTSHMSAVDGDGNAVAITTSINNIFGSQVFSKTTGVLLGNTMDDFGVPGEPDSYGIMPSEANFIVPGKRVSYSNY